VTRWREVRGGLGAAEYAARFAALAQSGAEIHGEADFCSALLADGGSVLDAGCGTGRVAIELARRGFSCTGVDIDRSMLDVARSAAPELSWVESDLSQLDLDERFDLVVAAGNVIPLAAPGTEAAVVARLSHHMARGGVLVTGFGLDAAHLPLSAPPFTIEQYDEWCSDAGLALVSRFATWDRRSFADSDHGYAVNVHRSIQPSDGGA
jgi:SAM-dependent methyltransferase